MFGTLPRDSFLVDLEDQSTMSEIGEALKGGEGPRVPLEQVEALLDQAERSVATGHLEEAERTFRKVLWSVAYCEMGLARKRAIVSRCVQQLLMVRPPLGKPPTLQFSDITRGGIVHMYHFEIAEKADRDRLARVIADREVAHDGPSIAESCAETERGPLRMGQRLRKAPLLSRTTPPRNAPCPCGSGWKYKNCCGKSSRE